MGLNNTKGISLKLWKIFWISVVLPVIFFVAVVILLRLGLRYNPPVDIRVWGIFLLIFSVTFGVALPVLFRTTFHGKYINQNGVTPSEYVTYQRNTIIVCSIAMVSASLAYLSIVSSLYLYGSILASLYGVYSAIPFREKIMRELKIYKLEKNK